MRVVLRTHVYLKGKIFLGGGQDACMHTPCQRLEVPPDQAEEQGYWPNNSINVGCKALGQKPIGQSLHETIKDKSMVGLWRYACRWWLRTSW